MLNERLAQNYVAEKIVLFYCYYSRYKASERAGGQAGGRAVTANPQILMMSSFNLAEATHFYKLVQDRSH